MPSTRTRPAEVTGRAFPVPSGGTTLQLIGDVHVGANETLGIVRRGKITSDLIAASLLPTPEARVQLGDLTEAGSGAQDTLALSWLDGLPDVPTHLALGNHDIWNNTRTPAQWALAYGMPSHNYTSDVGDVRLIVVGPDSLASGNTVIALSPATLTWLDEQLAATSRPCFIACHAPLAETVLGNVAEVYTSRTTDDGGAFAVNSGADTAIRDVLAAHGNARGWFSGHTHSPISTPGLVGSVTLGGKAVATVNASAPAFVGRSYQQLRHPINSLYVTYLGDSLDVRFRNHGARVWDGPSSVRVLSVAL